MSRPVVPGKRIKDMPEYSTWIGMIVRCTNPKCWSYERYGGAGITVTPEWVGPGGFGRFLEHIGYKPTPEHQLDRIDNDRSYEPGNVRWVTKSEQMRNRTSNVLVTVDGVTMCMTDWATENGIKVGTVHQRIKNGWDPVRAVTEPTDPKGGRFKKGWNQDSKKKEKTQ